MNRIRRWLARGNLTSLRFRLACWLWRWEYAGNEADGDWGDPWWVS